MSVLPSLLASTTRRRRPFSRRIWFGPVGLLDLGDLARRNPAGRRLDQEVAEPLRRAQVVRQPHHHVEAAVAVDHARHHAAVRQPAELIDHRRGLHAVKRGAAVIDADFELRDAHLLLDLQVGQAGNRRELAAQLFGLARMVSRSSPKIFSAISERMPDSMWSSRCEIGWPILTDSGSTESRARISATISVFGRVRRLQIDFEFGDVDALGMLVEFGAAGAPADRFHLRHLHDQAFGDRADAVGFGKRDAGIEGDLDGEGAFVERRQERARQRERRGAAAATSNDRDAEDERGRGR